MALVRAGTTDPSVLFDEVLDATHQAYIKNNGPTFEQRLVRELISESNITGLNLAAAIAYDTTKNIVHFRGGFLHNNPHAEFKVKWPGGEFDSKRELADALLLVYISEPDKTTGKPVIVQRAACLLMFKVAKKKKPKTLAFRPGIDPLPEANSDNEQFYLFNKWPDFGLKDRKTPSTDLGTFSLKCSNYEIGKYAVVYTGDKQSRWKNKLRPGAPTNWLFADPKPQQAMSADPSSATTGSLGYLLEALVERTGNVGLKFNKTSAFTIGSSGGWDELMSFLLGYVSPSGYQPGYLAQQGLYLAESRDVNPAIQHFAHFGGELFEQCTIADAAFYELLANSTLWDRDLLPWFPNRTSIGELANEERGMPVLIATVMKRTPTNRPD